MAKCDLPVYCFLAHQLLSRRLHTGYLNLFSTWTLKQLIFQICQLSLVTNCNLVNNLNLNI